MPPFGVALIVGATLAWTVSPAAGQCRYEVTRIEGPGCPFGAGGTGWGINNRGDIAGEYFRPICYEAAPVSWSSEGGFVELAHPFSGRAYAINDAGQVVGRIAEDDRYVFLPALWENGALIELDLLPGATEGEALSINDRGQIVGYSYNSGTGVPFAAVVWDNGEAISLDPLLNARSSGANDINNHSQIVGWRRPKGAVERAFLLDGDELIDLGGTFQGSEAVAINDDGIVVGNVLARIGPLSYFWKAVMWVDGVPVDLNIPPRIQGSLARDINNAGEVIAQSFGPGARHYVIRGGEVLDINTLLLDDGATVTDVCAINDSGQITGTVDPATDLLILTPRSDPPGDLTCDGLIDITDLVRLLRAWGECGLCTADLNGDGVVDLDDLYELISNWT